jgi:hypothetical protein
MDEEEKDQLLKLIYNDNETKSWADETSMTMTEE